jgi:CheY-like chemotaxis protein
VRKTLVVQLGGQYEVCAVAGGVEAMATLSGARFDAVISDLRMPGVNGIEVLERARLTQPDSVRILLTGFVDDAAARRASSDDASFSFTIGKPWHDDLAVTLSTALAQRAARLEGLPGAAERARGLRLLPSVAAPLPRSATPAQVRAVSRSGTHPLVGPTPLSAPPGTDVARQEWMALAWRGALGGMAGACLHEMASVLQCLQFSLVEVEATVRGHAGFGPAAIEPLDDACAATERVLMLFRSARTFLTPGDRGRRRCSIDEIVAQGVAVCSGYRSLRTRLKVAPVPEAQVEVDPAALVQVVVDLLRNVADLAPRAAIHVDTAVGERVVIAVVAEGRELSDAERARLFAVPFSHPDAHGVVVPGLAFAADVVREHGGTLDYVSVAGNGRFELSLPRVSGV